MGKPSSGNAELLYTEYIGIESTLGELKHLSTQGKENNRDSLSSGERKGNSPNLNCAIGYSRCI